MNVGVAFVAHDQVGLAFAYRQRMLEGQVFSHRTAAALHGIPLPRSADRRIHVGVRGQRTPPRGHGVVGHRLSNDVLTLRTPDGTPLCSPEDTWCQLAELLDRRELVAAADHLLGSRARPATTSLDRLKEAVSRYAGKRGARNRAWALARVRWGVDSRPESLLRLFITEDLGLQDVLVNDPTPVAGGLILHPDLKLPALGLLVEYEGDHHRVDPRQWRADIERGDLLSAVGWRTIRATSHDLFVDRSRLTRLLTPREGPKATYGTR
ncbi:endonuclease domain-containing protein [Leifsonia poae]|uniref:endonuclease domain-containing protein n=1 Tax=Leifsonia poae TaxID=110933 RepID=UPI003D66A721